MNSRSIYSPEPARGWLPWGALAPVLGLVFVVATQLLPSIPLTRLGWMDHKGDPIGFVGLVAFLLIPFAFLGLVVLAWTRFVERRPLATIGLTTPRPAGIFLRGLLIGMGTILAVVLASWAAGGFTALSYGTALHSSSALLNIGILLLCFILQASVEELLFRGWLLSVIARKFNVLLAVVLTSLLFCLLHYSRHQPGLVTLNTMLFALFTCCWALKSQNIWGVMGWHSGWNWLLATGFDLPVTGLDAGTPALLIELKAAGPDYLTGGAQGPEGSVYCSAFFAAAIAGMLWHSHLARRRLQSRA